MSRMKLFEKLSESERDFWQMVESVAKSHGFTDISGVEFLVSTKTSYVRARCKMSRYAGDDYPIVEHVFENATIIVTEPLVAAFQFFATVCEKHPEALEAAKESIGKEKGRR